MVFLDRTNYACAELQCKYSLPGPALTFWCITSWVNTAVGPNFYHYFHFCISFGKNSSHKSNNRVEFPLQCVSGSSNSKIS